MSWPVQRFVTLVADTKNAIVGGPFGSKLTTRDYVDEGVPVIRGANMSNGRFILEDDFVFVTDEKKRNDLQSNLARPGDLIFTQRGTLGQVAIIPSDAVHSEFVVSQSQMKATLDAEKADTNFYYYFFSSQKVVDAILNMTSSSGVPHINLGALKDFEVPVPPLRSQQRIAGILSAYDDLIENNRRRIGLLEMAARLLYREWFVHLRFPGHETAKIVDGLPEGWNRGIIADLFDTSSGGTPSRKNEAYFGGNINWLKTQELNNGFIFETDEKITEDGLKYSSAKLFPENAVIVAMYGATIGQLAILANPSSTNQACCALIPKRSPSDYLFGYCLMENSATALKDLGQGAAQNNVSQQVIRSMGILIPAPSVIDMFSEIISESFQQRRNLQAQNAKLTRARDLLLPRLMDGRIPV